MLAAIAEFALDLIVERIQDGLAAARARGRKGGRRFKMTPNRARQARAMYDAGQHTVQQIADTFGSPAQPSTGTSPEPPLPRPPRDRPGPQP